MKLDGVYIIKANGTRELFNPEKLKKSLLHAKATDDVAQKIVSEIQSKLKEGETTNEIYKQAFYLLEKHYVPAAVKYSLRKAIMELGPSGFPFEKFVAEIFKSRGFETLTDVEMLGECVGHEVDVVAWSKEKLIIVEAKFHNALGIKSDLKVVLYVKARFDDLANTLFDYGGKRKIDESWLVTNTKFSSQAIHYAECKNMKLVGWNYPKNGSLHELVERAHLHPITCLRGLSNSEKQMLLTAGIVLCKTIEDDPELVVEAGLHREKVKNILKEISEITEWHQIGTAKNYTTQDQMSLSG